MFILVLYFSYRSFLYLYAHCKKVQKISKYTKKTIISHFKSILRGEFPGGLVVRIRRFHCRDPSSIPGGETEIPQATGQSQKTKNKNVF